MSNNDEELKDSISFEESYVDETIQADQTSKAKAFVKKFMKRKTAVIAFVIIVLLLITALIGPKIAPYPPDAYDYDNLLSTPSSEHWFGTDQFGRDIFSRILAGTPLTIGVALSSVIVGAFLGTVLGLLAGYYGGWIEMLVMRGSDVLFSFPDILLAIAIVAILGPGLINVFIAVAVFTVPSFARIMRSATLSVKNSLYVEVARSLGCKDSRILFLHIFPGTIQSMIVNFTMRIGSAIMAASSLSFLGFGANVTDPEWGAMLSLSRSYLSTAPHMVYLPGMVIFITVLAFNLFGDGLRDTLDPKLK
ncbi:ABC transporter permease subunit [Tyzzerella sp. OttesenSCG-928-J15]|nr:ABC transporter permease subunit [Tyzzerella sp. OttesenSCG-928-J15]